MEPSTSERSGREIREVALLDLTGARAEAALEGVTRISEVATILVPESLVAKLSSIPMDQVASIVPVPDGGRPKVFTGQITLSGEALANTGGRPEDILVIVGQLILTSPVHHVGYSDLIVIGKVCAPTGSETALGAGIRRLTGQVTYYPYVEGTNVRVHSGSATSGESLTNATGQPSDVLLVPGTLVVTSPVQRLGYQHVVAIGPIVVPAGTDPDLLGRLTTVSGQVVTYTAPPRVFDGKDNFSAGFFELFDSPMTLVLDGKFSFDDDVAPELLRQKVAGIVLDGKIDAPRRLVPMLQMLCIVKDGVIQARPTSETK